MSINIVREFNVNEYITSNLRLTKISGTFFNDINNFSVPTRVFFTQNYVYRTPVRYLLDNNQLFGTNGFINYWNTQIKDGTLPFPDTFKLPQGDFTAQPFRGYSIAYRRGLWELNMEVLLYNNVPVLSVKYTRDGTMFTNTNEDDTGAVIPFTPPGSLTSSFEALQQAIDNLPNCI